jgi:plastocyanin
MRFFKKLSTWQLVLAAIVLAGTASFAATYATSAGRSKVADVVCTGHCISLSGNEASPNTLAVETGSYVQFNSADGKTYNLGLGKPDGSGHGGHQGDLQSGDFGKGEAYRLQLSKEGSYIFYDRYNEKISVLVIVYEPGKQYKVE